MDSRTSWVLIGLIAVVGLDITVFLMFVIYKMIEFCTRRHSYGNLMDDEFIRYEDMVAIQTKPVPMVFDGDSSAMKNGSDNPKKIKEKPTEDFDVPMYISEMLQRKLVDGNEEEQEPKPVISLSIYFNAATNELTIILKSGKNIRCDTNNEQQQQHIQVSAMLMPDGNILHSCRGIPPKPLFKHQYEFGMNVDKLKCSTVKFNVWKVDKYSRKTPYGDCVLNLATVFKDDHKYSSDVFLEIEQKDELADETMKGELLTSIQYMPVTERINVNIMKGRGFHFEDFDKDVYVKVSAVVKGKVIKNRKTSNAKKSPNPVFNEMTQFQLDSEMTLENTTIITSVYVHRSRGSYKRLIGRSYIGNGDLTQSTGREYWREIIKNPQKMIARWLEIQ